MKKHAEKCPRKTHEKDAEQANITCCECTCDGYHTFNELYEHRITLFIALCYHMHDLYALEDPGKYQIWRSKLHSDGTSYDGWFIVGIGTKKGQQITYHIPMEYWDKTSFIEEREKAPEWDGHTPDDVLIRLREIAHI